MGPHAAGAPGNEVFNASLPRVLLLPSLSWQEAGSCPRWMDAHSGLGLSAPAVGSEDASSRMRTVWCWRQKKLPPDRHDDSFLFFIFLFVSVLVPVFPLGSSEVRARWACRWSCSVPWGLPSTSQGPVVQDTGWEDPEALGPSAAPPSIAAGLAKLL